MDYKEKYEAALSWMKKIYPTLSGADKEDAEHYFPELRESEDERIRKKILAEYKDRLAIASIEYKNPLCNKEIVDFLEKALAYLEKQKENPKSADSIPPDCASDAKCENSWHKVADSLSDREVLKRIEEVVQYLKEHNYTVAVEDSHPKYYEIKIHRHDDDFWLSEQYKYCRHIIGEYYYEGNFGGDIFTIYVLRSKEKQKEQKPAEWSEEDELKMNSLLNYLDPDTGGTKYSSCAQLTEWYNWLKSLRSRPKSSDNWKPSKEQMAVLEIACKYEGVFTQGQLSALLNLKEQLKKL